MHGQRCRLFEWRAGPDDDHTADCICKCDNGFTFIDPKADNSANLIQNATGCYILAGDRRSRLNVNADFISD